jgi:chemotaxis protein methyltransferase CheR
MALPSEAKVTRADEPVLLLLRDLVHERTAVYFESDRLDLMLDKLADRLKASGSPSYLDYYYLLKYDEHGTAEWRRVMDAFSVQETYFWRELDQVRALVDHVVPAWFRRTSEPLRIWSAACASGEEPYSIAIALNEAGWGGYPIEIYALDASESALSKARSAVYRERAFRSLPADLRQRYFSVHPDGLALREDIKKRVNFRWGNLADRSTYDDLPGAPVIFCRNVFIYFSPASITRVAGIFADHMPAGGHLFIGASESLLKLTNRFDLHEIRGAFVYVRQPGS